MPDEYDWWVPPLDSSEQRLVEAYRSVGRPLDDLPYTEDFIKLCAHLGVPASDEARHDVYKQLLRLRRTGRLPRLGLLKE